MSDTKSQHFYNCIVCNGSEFFYSYFAPFVPIQTLFSRTVSLMPTRLHKYDGGRERKIKIGEKEKKIERENEINRETRRRGKEKKKHHKVLTN